MVLHVGGVISGQPREKGRQLQQAHIFTPESASTTHYFYAVSFPRVMGPQAEQLANQAVETLRGPFETEDKPIVEAIARNMGTQSFWDCKPLLVSIDGAATLARRILARKIEAEQSCDASR